MSKLNRSVEQLGSPVDPEGPGGGAISRKFAAASKSGPLGARNGRGGTWGSISRVFARSRNKSKALSADGVTECELEILINELKSFLIINPVQMPTTRGIP